MQSDSRSLPPFATCVRSRLRDPDCFQWVRYLGLRLPLGGAVVEPRGIFPRHRPLEQHAKPAQQVCVAKMIVLALYSAIVAGGRRARQQQCGLV